MTPVCRGVLSSAEYTDAMIHVDMDDQRLDYLLRDFRRLEIEITDCDGDLTEVFAPLDDCCESKFLFLMRMSSKSRQPRRGSSRKWIRAW